jgi:hypothetical protein
VSESDDANEQLNNTIDTYLEQMGWADPDLPVIDVLVVVQRRGFDRAGGKSVVSTIVPTDSTVPSLLGMIRHAQMRFEKMVDESLEGEE